MTGRTVLPAAATLAALATLPTTAGATTIDARTLRVSSSLGMPSADGPSANPALSSTGRVIAFDTTATGLVAGDGNATIRDVVTIDRVSGARILVSAALDGAAADGPSIDPTLSANGQRVAFTSAATNLVAGDGNGVPDVFVRVGTGAVVMASVRPDGLPGNRASSAPELSADGRYLVFESEASDLVPGDSNGVADVFVRDLATGRTARVSVGSDGEQAVGRSGSPAISADGRVVAFESQAANLVARDTNRTADVFVRDLRRNVTERVSVSSAGRQQNRSVAKPFRMVVDLDRTGRRVVFDSEATNLTGADGNGRADVFLRDRRAGTTRLVSASTANVQGNNDSIAPTITPAGRHVAFQSFATNLASGDAGGADVFVRDLSLGVTTVMSVAADGSRRQPELVPQLLQRPALSNTGATGAFISTATNLTPGDANRHADVFVRLLDAPRTRIRRRERDAVLFTADDPAARSFVCRAAGRSFPCGSRVGLGQATSRLVVRATGPGILPDPRGVTIRTRRDTTRPSVRITSALRKGLRTIRGTAADKGGAGLRRVEISVRYLTAQNRCFGLSAAGTFRTVRNCSERTTFVAVPGSAARWSFRLPRALPRSVTAIAVRSVDAAGNRSRVVERLKVLL